MRPEVIAVLAGAPLLFILKHLTSSKVESSHIDAKGSQDNAHVTAATSGRVTPGPATEDTTDLDADSIPATIRSNGIISLCAVLVLLAAVGACAYRECWDAAAAVLVCGLVMLYQASVTAGQGLQQQLAAQRMRQAAAAQQQQDQRDAVNWSLFQGSWIKDGARSDSMEAAIKLIELNGVIRTAIRMIRGVELKLTDSTFEFAVFSIFPWFKVRERYPLSGEASPNKRRDLRRGKHRGRVALSDSTGSINLSLEWDEPHGGQGVDEFKLIHANELHVTSTLLCKGQTVRYTQVYTRSGRRQ